MWKVLFLCPFRSVSKRQGASFTPKLFSLRIVSNEMRQIDEFLQALGRGFGPADHAADNDEDIQWECRHFATIV